MENNTKQTKPEAPQGCVKQRYEAPKLERLAVEETHISAAAGGDANFQPS